MNSFPDQDRKPEPGSTSAFLLITRVDGALLLVHKAKSDKWGLPGGRVESGESAVDAARRESLEELGAVFPLRGDALVCERDDKGAAYIFPSTLQHMGIGEPRPSERLAGEIDRAAWFAPGKVPERLTRTARCSLDLLPFLHST